MPSDPIVLAFDTSAAHCAAALLCGTAIVATHVEERAKGQAERLVPLLEEMLAKHDLTWSALSRIGVGVGPGNFTGIRISVSAARGMALGLGIPAIGVSTLQAIRHDHPDATAAVMAPRERVYVQGPDDTPRIVALADVETPVFLDSPSQLVANIARIASTADLASVDRPKPLYIKQADAAPARDTAPALLS